eukprot:364234-Chlamydomonas_euryale.AAC.13
MGRLHAPAPVAVACAMSVGGQKHPYACHANWDNVCRRMADSDSPAPQTRAISIPALSKQVPLWPSMQLAVRTCVQPTDRADSHAQMRHAVVAPCRPAALGLLTMRPAMPAPRRT